MEGCVFQRQAQLSRFDDSVVRERRENALKKKNTLETPPVVPAKHDTVFCPGDPRADWGGLVKRESSRAHVSARHPSQTALPTGRRHFDADARFTTEPERQGWAAATTLTTETTTTTTTQDALRGVKVGETRRRTGKKHVAPPAQHCCVATVPPPQSMLVRAASSVIETVGGPPQTPPIPPRAAIPGYTGRLP